MTDNGSGGSTVPRRTLGIALRQAREHADVKLKDAADHLGASTQTVWRMENGLVATRPATVLALCDFYRIKPNMREVLVGLSKETRARGWWHSYGDVVPTWFELYIGLEAAARRIRTFEPLLVPGLLQAEGYMAAVIRNDQPHLDDEGVTSRIELRRSRQNLLTRTFPEPPQLEAIIAESVLMADDAMMRAQVWHLLKATESPTVTVRVVPMRTGPHRASVAGALSLLDFRTENGSTPPSTVYCENVTGAIYLDRPAEIDTYEQVWAALDRVALTIPESIDLMARRLKELNDRED